MKILLLEAYYGGSHRLWADQLSQYSKHEIQVLGLSARHWKWRMEGGAIALSQQLKELSSKPDLLLATSMLDLSFLKSNLPKGWENIPTIYYMHENQLSYPQSDHDTDKIHQRDFHYGMIQFKSMLVADKVCFNSAYNKRIFFEELDSLLSRLPDHSPTELMEQVKQESMVLHLGIRDTKQTRADQNQAVILWNHRWEYDKNPNTFFDALIRLKDEVSFKLIVLGSSSRNYPEVFDRAKEALSGNIMHWGYAETDKDYLSLLNSADILPVTSHQEFFGISIMEAILAGATPLLPNRLVYPEHFDPNKHQNLYYETDKEFHKKLKHLIQNPIEESQKNSLIHEAKEYLWSSQIAKYDQLFESFEH